MSSIDQRISKITNTRKYDDRIKTLNSLSQKTKDQIRKPIEKFVEERCQFCQEIITKEDTTLPNVIMESKLGSETLISHGDCLEYLMKKYPFKSVNESVGCFNREDVKRARSVL